MKLLLDTCTFLWILLDDPRLSSLTKELFKSPENQIYLSSVSIWEIMIKHKLGKLPLPQDPKVYLPNQRQKHHISTLTLSEEAVLQLVNLPDLHKDPFDRMLVCQAIVQGWPVLTPDKLIRQYPIRVLW